MNALIKSLHIAAVGMAALLLAACGPAAEAASLIPTATEGPQPTRAAETAAVPTVAPATTGDLNLTAGAAGTTVSLKVGQTLTLALEGNPTTGYTWDVAPAADPVLEQAGEPAFTAGSDLLGAPGTMVLTFKAIRPGEQTLSLAYRRPFEKDTAPLKTLTLNVIVEGEPSPAAPTASAIPADWLTYTNSAYGFSFRYPPDWELEEIQDTVHTLYGHAVWLYPSELMRLQIAFKRTSEDLSLGRTGLGSGDLIERGSVAFGDQTLTRQVLVLDGKDRTVMYHGNTQRGDLVFDFGLDYLGLPTDSSALTQPVEAAADQIVGSIR